ncbi:MAG: hypothetical protein JO352_21085 [Chloroflexi bacterium]|nr:hypothetical protein [Chloroflexota bacterium]MBV9596429.1 hypothetical protein [Chloroflexota bacterium]
MSVLDHYPWAVFIHILGALGLFVALEWLAASATSAMLRHDADQQPNGSLATASVSRSRGVSAPFLWHSLSNPEC